MGGGEDVSGVSGVEDVEGEGGLPSKDAGEDFWRKAGAAHTEEEDVGEAFGADFGGKGGQFGGVRGHVGRAVEPAETFQIADRSQSRPKDWAQVIANASILAKPMAFVWGFSRMLRKILKFLPKAVDKLAKMSILLFSD